MTKTAAPFITFLLLSPFRLFAGFDLNSVTAAHLKTAAIASPAPAPAARAEIRNVSAEGGPAGLVGGKDWTIMVFMNGKSNIEPFALNDLNRFETVGSGEKVNIVAELGRAKGLDNDTAADGDWEGVRRYLVVKDADKERLASPVLMDLGKADMGDYKEVVSFMNWARSAYPARRRTSPNAENLAEEATPNAGAFTQTVIAGPPTSPYRRAIANTAPIRPGTAHPRPVQALSSHR